MIEPGFVLRMTKHAQKRAIRRHITPAAVLRALHHPDRTWESTIHTKKPCTAYQRGALRVVLADDDQCVVTVLWDINIAGTRYPAADHARRLIQDLTRETL